MLQVFYLDVAKVDLDVAYAYMLQTYVSSVFRCFIRMFASVLSGCCICVQWFSNFFRCFRKCFRCLFQVFYLSSLNVSKVEALHMRCVWEAAGDASNIQSGVEDV
jgi:hypothetical protein